jgi:hypothetical protein
MIEYLANDKKHELEVNCVLTFRLRQLAMRVERGRPINDRPSMKLEVKDFGNYEPKLTLNLM